MQKSLQDRPQESKNFTSEAQLYKLEKMNRIGPCLVFPLFGFLLHTFVRHLRLRLHPAEPLWHKFNCLNIGCA